MNKPTKRQITAIRTAAAQVFGPCTCRDRDGKAPAAPSSCSCDYHHWLAQNFSGITSTKDLSGQETSACYTLLCKLTGHNPPPPGSALARSTARAGWVKRPKPATTKKSGSKHGRITADQVNKLYALQILLGWENKQIRGFITRQTGKHADVQMLTEGDATKTIIGLQRIIAAGDKDIYRLLNAFRPGDVQTPLGKAALKLLQNKLSTKEPA